MFIDGNGSGKDGDVEFPPPPVLSFYAIFAISREAGKLYIVLLFGEEA